MLKLRIALCLALVVGTLTLLNGMLQGARLETVIYRMIISIAIFGFIGYGIGMIVESFLHKKLIEKFQKNSLQEEVLDKDMEESEFTPFTSNSFEQITRPKE